MQHSPGWYQRFFAWVMAHGMVEYEQSVADRKQTLFADLHGTVVEIGPGAGANLAYYPTNIHWIGIEPNPFMHPYLQQQADRLGLKIDLRRGTAEQLDLEDSSVDAVISTLVLCSVNHQDTVLKEILRVLKPGGQFLFLEHVAAPAGTGLRRLQNWVAPLWRMLADGCHPNRETGTTLENAGFASVKYHPFQAPLPIVSPQIIGVATKKTGPS